MAQFITTIRTDLNQPLGQYTIGGKMFTQDNKANRINVELYKGNAHVEANGEITGIVKRNDGKAVAFMGGIENGNAYIVLPETAYAVEGPIDILVRETVDDVKTVIAVCKAYVTKTADADYVTAGSTVVSIEELVAVLDELDPLIARLQAVDVDTLTSVTEKIEDIDERLDTLAALENEMRVEAIADWLDKHPEATTTVQDGAISYQKLHQDVQDDIANLQSASDEQDATLAQAVSDLSGMVNGGFVENNALYLTHDGVIVAGPFEGIGGGGGSGGSGGGSNNAVMSIANKMPWLATTIRAGASCPVTVNWSSTIDEVETGIGSLRITANGAIRATMNVNQGDVTVDIGEYTTAGNNSIRLTITDTYGNSRSIVYTVTSVQLSISSSFDDGTAYTDAFAFPYKPIGAVEKTVHFKLDGREMDTVTTTVSNRQLSYNIPAQEHGAHSLEVWFTAEINEEAVESNRLYYEFVALEDGETDVIIASDFNETSVQQYDTIQIPYRVYDPAALEAEVEIYEGEELKSTVTVGREKQTYAYHADTAGSAAIKIVSGETEKEITFTVAETEIDVTAETDGLQLYLNAKGRSNLEANPAVWTSGTVSVTFSNFNWTSDGWQQDEDGSQVLRVAGDARVTIPFQIFGEDFRTGGKTVEIEFATRDTRDYDAEILSCYSGGRGIALTAQTAMLASEQSSIAAQFKEDEHVRIGFVVEKRSEQRLIFCYINGIASGVVRYPENDDFSQTAPVGISIGSNDSTMDIYSIRVYDHDLTKNQMLNNWIADTQSGRLMLERYRHNNVYDEYGNIVIAKLPSDLPYMILEGALPAYKGNKLIVSGSYVDPVHPEKSFTFENAQIDVQGTSSQYYARKNYKIKFNGGFTVSGNTVSKYAMNADAVPTKTFTFKADVASSEGANNVELARLYNEACPYKTPYQLENSKVRQGIDGFPIVIFHNDGTSTYFLGKYNFNNDKGTKEVFGFSEGDESWEIRNNTSLRVLWKSDDYTSMGVDADGKPIPDWLNDFEARYPEDNTDSTNLKALATWLKSTDQEQATGDALPEAVTYTDGEGQDAVTTTYTNDTAAYRLAKFRHELPDWMEVDAVLFYYLFTELFLMVDSRAKNAFPSKMGGSKWFILPYDFDTALGINNEGTLAFSYNLEDIDHLPSGADIFNGQASVLWVNLRQAYYTELRSMYQELRSNGALSYEKTEAMFETHQGKWPEAVFNEDAQFKYIDPLINDGDGSYLKMLQGSKEEQRKWWMYNRFRYMDSKYNAGDALTDVIQVRGYAKANVTVTPYADIYPAVKYGSYLVTKRGQRDVATTLLNPLDNVNDTEIYIYSASQLASVGDLSGLKVGFADFSKAIKLQNLKIGDNASTYENGNLTELYLGSNTLLQTIDVRNCSALAMSVDLRGCTNLEEAYFDGTAVTGVQMPNGGVLNTLHLPSTITNLTILNQKNITDLVAPTTNLTTLRIENCPSVNTKALLNGTPDNARVRLMGFAWEAEDAEEIEGLLDKLDSMRGLDENGNNTEKAQVSGTIHTDALTGAQIASYNQRYPYLTVTADSISATLTFKTWDGGSTLATQTILDGGNGTDITHPARTQSDKYTYTFAGWALTPGTGIEPNNSSVNANALNNVSADRTVYAAYSGTIRSYTVYFARSSEDGGGTLQTSTYQYGQTPSYTGTTPTTTKGSASEWAFKGWTPEPGPITGSITYYALFADMNTAIVKYLSTRNLVDYESDEVTAIGQYAFYQMTTLKTVTASALSMAQYAFNGCTNLEIVDLTGDGQVSIADNAFSGNGNLKQVIIRSSSVATLANYNAFNSTGRCLIYVPDSLVSSYKAANQWSNAAVVDRIYGISEIGVHEWTEEEIADDDATLFAAIADGTAHTKYKQGQYRTLNLGTEGNIRMQIVDFNVRELANSTATAEIEWLAMDALKTNHRMNPANDNNTEGTGTIGGYDKSEMKTYLDETIWPLIPSGWKNVIKETKIVSTINNTSGQKVANETTTVKLRIPSNREVFGGTSYETTGPIYSMAFPDGNSRIRRTAGTTSAVSWWLRSAAATTRFRYVSNNGYENGYPSQNNNSVVLGFST